MMFIYPLYNYLILQAYVGLNLKKFFLEMINDRTSNFLFYIFYKPRYLWLSGLMQNNSSQQCSNPFCCLPVNPPLQYFSRLAYTIFVVSIIQFCHQNPSPHTYKYPFIIKYSQFCRIGFTAYLKQQQQQMTCFYLQHVSCLFLLSFADQTALVHDSCYFL